MEYDVDEIPDRPTEGGGVGGSTGFFDFLKLENMDDIETLAKYLGAGAVVGQSLGLFGDNQPTVGYQGGIPDYTAVRKRVPNTFDPDRRPGSGGRRYFTDTTYVDMDADTAQVDLADAIAAADTQADALAKSNRVRQRLMAGEPVPVDTSKSKMYPTDEPANEPASFSKVPTAESVLSQNMSPSEETSPFTSPYQYIEDDPTNPLNIATPYNQGRKVNKGLSTIEKALMNYDPGKYDRGLSGLLGLTKPGPEIKERPSFTEIDLGMNDPDKRIRTAFQKRRFGELPMTPKEEAEFLRMFGTDYIDRAGPKGSRRREYATGGIAELGSRKQRYLDGETDGMADKVPATIDNEDPAALSDGEYVIPADVVSHLGNGNSDAGAKVLDEMLSRVREARTGDTEQAPEINPKEFLPA
jgi:hypothetical protein